MRHPPVRPPFSKEGDAVGVISPASPVPALRPGRFDRGVRAPERMGFRVRAAENVHAIRGHTAGTAEERVADLHAMFADGEVRAVCSIGGYNSNQLLDKLDYDLIRENPKILVGYSDPTFLLLAIQKPTGLVTFLGPSLMAQFGEHGGPHPYTERWFRKTLMSPDPPGELAPSRLSTHEYLEWDRTIPVPAAKSPTKVLRPSGPDARRAGSWPAT